MQDLCTYDYAIVRVVPRVEREEFVNVGVLFSCPSKKFLKAVIAMDEKRLMVLYPAVDMESVRTHLNAISLVCAGGEQAGPIGKLSQRERFHWLTATRSTIIQTSSVHTGFCQDPLSQLKVLVDTMVRTPHASHNV